RTVNALSHYTDWTVGHVHSGALGWVAMITFGSLYYLIPRLYGRTAMHSIKAVELHFWVATVGVVLYIASMWIAGVQQGLMWRNTAADGTLVYSFVEELKTRLPYYLIRFVGGAMYLSGVFIMAWNVWMTVRGQRAANPAIPPAEPRERIAAAAAATAGRGAHGNQATRFFDAPGGREERRPDDRRQHPGGVVRRAGADRPAVLPAFHHPGRGRRRALRRPAPDGARRIYPRRLRGLPFAAGAHAAGRGAALRRLFRSGRVGVRPSVPVGLQAHRPGPGARG